MANPRIFEQDRKTIRLDGPKGQADIHYVGLSQLITNKRASGRPKDLDDLRYLEGRESA